MSAYGDMAEGAADRAETSVQNQLDSDAQVASDVWDIAAGKNSGAEASEAGAADSSTSSGSTSHSIKDILAGDDEDAGSSEFDSAFEQGALGEDFAPGVGDPGESFQPKERAIADRLTDEGWRTDAREADHSAAQKNPDAMVRKSPTDPGTITEFKTMETGSPNALKREINSASGQVPEDGEVVIDGRGVGTTEEDAERAFRRALGQPGKPVAAKVHVILGDGSLRTYTRGE